MSIKLKIAKKSDLNWVNQKYQEVDFPASNFETEFIAIAQYNNEKAGLGRVIKVDNNNAELGGMYVDTQFRGQGIASKIIKFLLKNNQNFARIYCLPFSNLENYYKKFGFKLVVNTKNLKIPLKIREKLNWCNNNPNFEQKVLLMCLKNERNNME